MDAVNAGIEPVTSITLATKAGYFREDCVTFT